MVLILFCGVATSVALFLPILSLDPSMGRDSYAMRAGTFHCPRCGVQVREINQPDEVDSAFAARTLRSVPGPGTDVHEDCRWERTLNNRLLRKWARVAARPSDVPECRKASGQELWLKVVIHLAGFGALLALPSVGALLEYLGDHLRLLR
jgi:hypothetical protein